MSLETYVAPAKAKSVELLFDSIRMGRMTLPNRIAMAPLTRSRARQIEGWRLVTDAVHAAGGRIFLQLWHVGRISHPALQPDGMLPVAPSAIRPAGQAFIENDRGEGELQTRTCPDACANARRSMPMTRPHITGEARKGTPTTRHLSRSEAKHPSRASMIAGGDRRELSYVLG
jgi:hypothetical protein